MTTINDIRFFLRDTYGWPAMDILVDEVTEDGTVLLDCVDDDWCDTPGDVARLILDWFKDINVVNVLGDSSFARIDNGR